MKMKLWATLAVVAGFMALSGNALATPESNAPSAQVVNSTTNAAVVGARASASDIATGKVVVLADMRVKPSVRVTSSKCFWTKGGFWNSGRATNGQARSFWDPVSGKLCPSKKSKTGWVKVAGGTSKRNCGNVASAKRPPFKVVTGKVLMVRSFASVRVSLTAKAAVRVTAVCGWAEASASAKTTVDVRLWVRSRGAVMNSLFASVSGKATARASAQLECVTAPPPPPPPPSLPPPPPSTCPPGTTGTPPNCKTPSPKSYTVKGSTSVQASKHLQAPCPAPNQSIVKTGSGSASLSSPEFTGSSNVSLAAAQADLNAKLAAWRQANQPTVDTQAQAQAQSNLNNALLYCPKPNNPPTVSITGPQHVFEGGTVTYCVSASDPDGDTLTYSFTTNYGSVVGNGNCYTYQAPMGAREGVTVTVTVNDGKGGLASATTAAFPVVADDF